MGGVRSGSQGGGSRSGSPSRAGGSPSGRGGSRGGSSGGGGGGRGGDGRDGRRDGRRNGRFGVVPLPIPFGYGPGFYGPGFGYGGYGPGFYGGGYGPGFYGGGDTFIEGDTYIEQPAPVVEVATGPQPGVPLVPASVVGAIPPNFTGVVETAYPDDSTATSTTYVDGIPNGLYRAYWDNGSLKEEGAYLGGRTAGTWRYFAPDGSPLAIRQF